MFNSTPLPLPCPLARVPISPFRPIGTLIPLKTLSRVSEIPSRSSYGSPAMAASPGAPRRSKLLERSIRVPANQAAAESVVSTASLVKVSTTSDVVRDFYDGINRRDLASVERLISERCVYEDLIFSQPFVGRKAILEFFKKFTESISKELQFVIDDISTEDTLAVGVTWHLEWQGKPFPFSKGCSFYRLEVLDGTRKIVYGRDCVEPAAKPGEMALVLIRGVTWLLQQFPQLADRF